MLAAHYETLQDKLAQLKDARDALNVLRDEHREKRRREQEELERLRQIQMAQKLEVLRQKKQVFLIVDLLSLICFCVGPALHKLWSEKLSPNSIT